MKLILPTCILIYIHDLFFHMINYQVETNHELKMCSSTYLLPYLPIHLFIYWLCSSIYLLFYLHIHLLIYWICSSIYLLFYLHIYLVIYLPTMFIHLPIYLLIYLFTYFLIYLITYLPTSGKQMAKANWPSHWDHGKNPKNHLNGFFIMIPMPFKWVLGFLPWSQRGGQIRPGRSKRVACLLSGRSTRQSKRRL
jgi:hypothetical protein